ncbi:RICIN domain-containing protein [Agarilytica rhodophyticola]|uniref:RICIN domain-containing protein n=1 Tax=Agarilytica rhodophyticola TaxID=1737490 RepID=UPI000B34469E|nr:RICIN domain-containing protein [Agarilytica rhodophyticola]
MLRKMYYVLLLISISCAATAKNYYVSKNGNDNNSGAVNSPWKTIQKAASSVKAGDQVYISRGTYRGDVSIKHSGRSNAWISFDAKPGDEKRVVLEGGTFRIIKKSFIRVSGIKVQKTRAEGFYVEGPASHITLSNNHTFDTYGSGIGVWGVGWRKDPGKYENIRNVKILNNKIEKANNGGYNECITLSNGVVNFEISGNEVFNGGNPINGGEGIDVKLGAKNGVIKNNRVHHLTRRGIYLDAAGILPGYPKPFLKNIEIFNNRSWENEGQGIAIMTEGEGDIHDIRVYNNLLYNNTEDGIMIYDHPGGPGDVYDIEVVNNTMFGNPRFGILLNFPDSHRMIFRNNIAYNNGTDLRFEHGAYVASHNLSNVNPRFVNAAAGNFRLRPDSPAINAGTSQNAPAKDFDGDRRINPDIGAYEYHDRDSSNTEVKPPIGVTSLEIRHSNKCLDLDSGSPARGTNIHQWSCVEKNANQNFTIVSKNDGFYEIRTKNNKCLGVAGGSNTNGANVVQWDCVGARDQQFKLDNSNNGWFRIIARHSNKCLDVAGVSERNGANIYQWSCHGGDNQRFKFR